ncbi:MAG: hypothetical protein ACHQAX_05750, partial [Gammaproteobacteria bacterium]
MKSTGNMFNIFQAQGELNNLANHINTLKKELNELNQAKKHAVEKKMYVAFSPEVISTQIDAKMKELAKAKEKLDNQENQYKLRGIVADMAIKPSAPSTNDTTSGSSQDEINQKALNEIVRKIDDTKKKINANVARIQEREAFIQQAQSGDNVANSTTDSILKSYVNTDQQLVYELNQDARRLEGLETQFQLNGVYEPAPYAPTPIATQYAYQPDYMDQPPAYANEPVVAYKQDSRFNYDYYTAKASYGFGYAATVAKHHLTPDEYKNRSELTWKKTADYAFSALLLAALMAASYDYVSSDDTKSTLLGCTYGLAGLALSYAFFVGWAMIKDKEIEYEKNLKANNNELGKVQHDVDHLFHMKMRTRWSMAALFSIVGFAVATSLQPEDIEFSAPGLLLAPIAAICIAMAMNHQKNMEAAQKDPNYVRKSYTELFKENFVTIIVAAIGLALIYNNAVVMNTDYGSAEAGNDAYRDALNLTARVGGGLFASAGLLIFIQQGINAMLSALSRDKELAAISNEANMAEAGKEGSKYYYYNQNTQSLSSCEENHRTDLGTKVVMERTPLESPDRRNNAIMHLILGLAFYAAYWSLSGEITMSEESSSFTKKAITVSAAFLATLCFLKAANNTEKHFNKIGR